MRRTVAAAVILALSLAGPAAHSAPERSTSFNDIACPPSQDDEEDPPEGRLSYSLMSISSVHRYSTGEGVRIGLLDSGVNPAHVSLRDASIEGGADFTGSDGGAASDSFGSGTTYASILVGDMDGDYPIEGLAPDATLVPIKIIDQVPETITQSYLDETSQRLADGIMWAVENDLDIVVTALALPGGSAPLEEAVRRADEAGLIIVAPAGELTEGDEPETASYRYPAAYDSVLAVTAVNSAGQSVPGMLSSDRVDIAAPGQNIPAAHNASNTGMCVTGKTEPSSLYAAVNAAGAAALLVSAHPDEEPAVIIHRLQSTALRPAPDRRTSTGWGIINPAGAIHAIDDGTAHGPESPRYGRQEEISAEGRDPLVPDADPNRLTEPIAYIGLAAGAALALALLLGAAGRRKGPR